jgi:KaiC/GvpD/RAD55 family RecA-like ATPase
MPQPTMKVDRISTGIIGLDKLMQGGWVKGSSNLVTGKTGTGKTAFAMSFLCTGAMNKEPGLYVTTEERSRDVKGDILSMFGWDLDALEKKGMLNFMSIMPTIPTKVVSSEKLSQMIKIYMFNLSNKIEVAMRKTRAVRVVIDSVSLIEMFIKDEYFAKVALMSLVEKLKNLNVTSLLTTTIPETSEALSGKGIVEYIVDSIVKLDFIPVTEEFKRTLLIRKMRRTNHSTLVHPLDITPNGMKIIDIKGIKKL